MGCTYSYFGSLFTTYTDANGTYVFTGYQDGRPKFTNENGWSLVYLGMDAKYYIADLSSINRYYQSTGYPCPDAMPADLDYKLVATGDIEGKIAGLY